MAFLAIPAFSRTEEVETGFEPELMVLAVRLNARTSAGPVRAARIGERFAISAESAKALSLRLDGPSLVIDGERYIDLSDVKGIAFRIDEAAQLLEITAAPHLFHPVRVQLSPRLAATTPPPEWGAFVNYDLLMRHDDKPDQTDGVFDLGLFGPKGAGGTSFTVRDMGGQSRAVRLETSWVRDYPELLASMRVGDAVSRAGRWGGATRFGGVQWGTNLALQPGFVAYPVPVARGNATLPSLVEVYLNEHLVTRRSVDPGTFEFSGLPVLTGRGEVRLLQRDVLGRVTEVVQPFYATPQLLRRGRHDFSYEVGAIRQNLGLTDKDYGPAVAVATHRYGVTDRLTGEVHAETLASRQAAGASVDYLLADQATVAFALAASEGEKGGGTMRMLQVERSARGLYLGARARRATADFDYLGTLGTLAPTVREQGAFAGFPIGPGSFSFNVSERVRSNGQVTRVTGTSYGLPLSKALHLRFMNTRTAGHARHTTGMVMLIWAYDGTDVSASTTRQGSVTEHTVQLAKSLPNHPGFGYRVSAVAAAIAREQVRLSARSAYGTHHVEYARAGEQEVTRLETSGGVVLFHGVHLAPRIDNAFALVEAPGFPEVGVSVNSNRLGVTDASGKVVVTQVQPRVVNRIRIDAEGLPIDTLIESGEAEAVPAHRSGVRVRLGVKPAHGVQLRLVDERNSPLAPGTLLRLRSTGAEFPVALDGEVFVTGVTESSMLEAPADAGGCVVRVEPASPGEVLPHLGTRVCAGSSR